jgi:hypothetical protein
MRGCVMSLVVWDSSINMDQSIGRAHIETQSRAGRRSTGKTAWRSVSAQWEVVSCNLAKWAMAEFIALSSKIPMKKWTHWCYYISLEKRVYEKEKTHGEFALTSEFCDKQFTNYVLSDGRTASIICSSIWCGFDRASSIICRNKMPTRCNRWIFIADLTVCSTCFGHLYAHHQEL